MASNFTIRDAKLTYRNFSGKPTEYKPEGRKEFGLLIEEFDFAQVLYNDGWNVKQRRKRDESEPDTWYLPVGVNYAYKPPEIYMIQGNEKILLTEATCGMLDWADILKIDLTITPYDYSSKIRGNRSIKAYLKTMFVTVEVDELKNDYANLDGPFGEEVPF